MSEPQHHWALDCPFYRSVGHCGGEAGCSAALEPLCRTEEPMTGWKRRDERGRFVKREGGPSAAWRGPRGLQ